MKAITSNLLRNLKVELKNANEIWVAVALLNNSGLENILQAIPKTCKLNFIVGINLPTEPKALSNLLSLKGKRVITAEILTEQFFHPKVYIIKSVGKYTAFVGSANCTNGGLEKNIEMTIETKDSIICKSLINWFENKLLPTSQPITLDFIKNYKPKYDSWIEIRKKEKEEISDLINNEHTNVQANIKKRATLISELKKLRRKSDYLQNKNNRQIVVRNLRKCLDYPNFKKLDLKTFFSNESPSPLHTFAAVPVALPAAAPPKILVPSELLKTGAENGGRQMEQGEAEQFGLKITEGGGEESLFGFAFKAVGLTLGFVLMPANSGPSSDLQNY